MKPHGLSANRLVRNTDMLVNYIPAVGKWLIWADAALRQEARFRKGADVLGNLQTHCDPRMTKRRAGNTIAKRISPLHAA